MSTTRTALLDSQDDSAETDATAPGDAAPAEAPPKFTLRGEAWTMFMLGWPMVVSFVCRIGMASTDTAFVGHLTNATTGVFSLTARTPGRSTSPRRRSPTWWSTS